jgi:hypothetical protein
MKKLLKLFSVTAFFMGVLVSLNLVGAEDITTTSEETPSRKVVVHYHRWDGEYEGRTVWTWNTGTKGSQAPVELSGTSAFGGTFDIFIDDDAQSEIGLILRYGAGWGNGQNDRDGLIPPGGGDKANKAIVIRDEAGEFTGFGEDGVKHVFVFEGSDDVIYQDETHGPLREGYGTLAVVYYDPAESYDGWNIWTWDTGTGGSAPANDTGVPFSLGALDVDGAEGGTEMFRVAFLSIGEDAGDSIGFIVRTDAWAKQWEEDLFIDVSDIKGEGFKTLFYIGNSDVIYTEFSEFEAVANAFEVENGNLEDARSLLVEFNKPIRVNTEEGDVVTSIFDPSWFTVTDGSGNVVPFASISYEQGVNTISRFMIIFENDLRKNVNYTLTYQQTEEDIPAVLAFAVPTEAPTITVIGSRSVTLELGDRYSLPTFRATEQFYGENLPLYNARVKDGSGFLSTREAGTYQIVLTATDRFGNVGEETITVTVVDPCEPSTAVPAVQITLLAGLPLLAGAYFALRRKEDQ